MNELTLAQFCEEAATRKAGNTAIKTVRIETSQELAKLPINRSTKRILATLDIPTIAAQFTKPLADAVIETKDPRIHYESIVNAAPSPAGITPLMKVASLMWNTGLVLRIPAGTKSDSPFALPILESQDQWPLVKVIVESGCEVTLIQPRVNREAISGIRAYSIELDIDAHSHVQLISYDTTLQLQRNLGTIRVSVAKDSTLTMLSVIGNGITGRYETEITSAGEGAEIDQRVIHLTTGAEQLDFVCNLIHKARNSKSRLVVRGAIGGTSYVRFEGRIIIAPGAQLTDAGLDEKTLFLSSTAKHDSVPALEINADDVKATHASSISKFDTEQLFYATSRGLTEAEAKLLIVEGMLHALTDGYDTEQMKPIHDLLTQQLYDATVSG